MRVLLPLIQSNGSDESATGTPVAAASTEHQHTDPDHFPTVSELNQTGLNNKTVAVGSFIEGDGDCKRSAVDITANDASHQRKRPSRDVTPGNPKRACVAAVGKKPPPQKAITADSKMTAPKFLEDERDEDILENSPPVAPSQRNFAVNNPAEDVDEDDAALTSGGASSASPVLHDDAHAQALKKRGLEIVPQAGDGNCLFRAVSLQVYGDASMHAEVRTRCMDFIAVNEEHFGQFVTGEIFTDYIARKRLDGVHGNNPEIQAISELYNRPVEVYTPDRGGLPLNIFHEEYSTADIPIRLSYHDGNHYNAVIDPIRPTAGLGLGLPGLHPGLADKQQVASAVMESDQTNDLQKAMKESEQELCQAYDDELQRALKESSESVAYMYKQKALAYSDLDATSLEMEQTALESSLQSYMQTELSRKKRASPEDNTGRARHRSLSPSLPAYAPAPTAAAAAAASPPVAAAAAAAAASPSTSAASPYTAGYNNDPYEYPAVVQELVMNGFELPKVIRAYELVGDNFDDLLAFLCSSGGYS